MKKIYYSLLLLFFSFLAKAQFPAPYCNVGFSSGVEPITKVVFAGINNSSPAAVGPQSSVPPLQDFLSVTGNVEQGSTYLISVEGNTDGNFQTFIIAFFDWNQDNDFTDPGEAYLIGTITNSTGTDGKKAEANILVPAGATLGSTRMRVMKKYGTTNPFTDLSTAPCNTTGYGQAEDYTINVAAGTSCTGTPNGGTATPTQLYLCSGQSTTITLTGYSTGTGLTFQWQSSPAGANTWSNVVGGSGATTATYTTANLTASTDFRCIVTCTASSQSANSTVGTVTVGNVPANDDVCNAITLVLDGARDCGNTTCATSVNDPSFSSSTPNNTVWYTFTPTTTGIYNIVMSRPTGVTTGLLNAWVGIYTATGTCPSLTLTQVTPATPGYDLTLNDSVTVATPTLTAGVTYYFMVDGNSGAFGAYCIRIKTPPAPPASCSNLLQPVNGATNVPYQNGVVIKYSTVPTATAYDIYFGTVNPPTTLIGASPADSALITGLTANTTYYWYVVPKNTGGTASGCNATIYSFTTAAPPPPPANDECTGALTITAGTPLSGSTFSATQSLPAISCGGFTGTADDDVWFKFTALQNGTAIITLTPDGNFDAVLEGFSGTCSSLNSLACADATIDGGIEVLTLNSLTQGTEYYFRVYSYGSTLASQGSFTLALSGSATLPVTLANFRGTKQNGINVLSWTTETENNNSGFELQRSADGVNYSTIQFVGSKAENGNSNTALHYEVKDAKPFVGTNYYRLKQIDKDGKFSLSSVVMLRGERVSKVDIVNVYPNPVINVLNVLAVSPTSERVNIVVSDVTGKVVMNKNVMLVTGDNTLQLNVSSLGTGTYTVKMLCANGCETAITKFTKQ